MRWVDSDSKDPHDVDHGWQDYVFCGLFFEIKLAGYTAKLV